jgi:hypothetical protein
METEIILRLLADKAKIENFLRSNTQVIASSREVVKLIEMFLLEEDEKKKDLILMQIAESQFNSTG